MLLLAVVLGVVLPAPATAHDVPDEIVLHAFVKPEGDRLHFLVRLPLVLLQSMGLSTRGPGYLDLSSVEEKFQAAAAAAAKDLVLHENGVALTHRLAAARISEPSDKSFETYAK